MSPTARTMRELRKLGTVCGIVERWNQHVGPYGIRQDLFGFLDIIAMDGVNIIGIQCCARSGHSAHRKKIMDNEHAPEWLESGGRIQLWSWAKQKVKRGGVAERWTPKVEEITEKTFENTP